MKISILQRLNPKLGFRIGWGIWLSAAMLFQFVVNINISISSVVFIFLCLISFYLGLSSVSRTTKFVTLSESIGKPTKSLFNVTLLLGMLGLLFKIIDRFIIRGISLAADISANRELMELGSGNFFGIFTSLLIPFGVIPCFLILKMPREYSLKKKILGFIAIVGQCFDALFLGSRSQLFIVFGIVFLFLLYFNYVKINLRGVLTTLIIGIIFFTILDNIFINRTNEYAGDNAVEAILVDANYNFTVSPSNDLQTHVLSSDGVYQRLVFFYITTSQYLLHGLFEFVYLFDHYEKSHAYGGYTFSVYFRFFAKILGVDYSIKDIQSFAVREGVYTSFFGPIFIDFGYFSLVFLFLFGIFCAHIYNLALIGKDWAVILYLLLFLIIIFIPIFNFINGAGGIFYLTALLIIGIFEK